MIPLLVLIIAITVIPSDAETRMIVVTHTHENIDWLYHMTDVAPVVIMSYTLATNNASDSVRTFNIPDHSGREVSGYLKYIIDHYDNLADHTAFIHAHLHSWHTPRQDTILRYANWSVNHYQPTVRTFRGYLTGGGLHPDLSDTWPELFEPYLGPLRQTEVYYHCCGSFIVPKSTIHRHSRQLYEQWYQWIADSPDFPRDAPKRKMWRTNAAWIFEYTWHRIFGMRHDDPDAMM